MAIPIILSVRIKKAIHKDPIPPWDASLSEIADQHLEEEAS